MSHRKFTGYQRVTEYRVTTDRGSRFTLRISPNRLAYLTSMARGNKDFMPVSRAYAASVLCLARQTQCAIAKTVSHYGGTN